MIQYDTVWLGSLLTFSLSSDSFRNSGTFSSRYEVMTSLGFWGVCSHSGSGSLDASILGVIWNAGLVMINGKGFAYLIRSFLRLNIHQLGLLQV